MGTGNVYSNTKQVLRVLYFLTWIAFIAVSVKAGAIIISFVVSWMNPEAARDIYKGMDLHALKAFSTWHYSLAVAFMVVVLCLKATVLELAIKAMSKVNLANPFSSGVARIMEKISYTLLAASVIAILGNIHADWILKKTGLELEQSAGGEFLFVAGLVFVISQIFKRGVELQSENELTV